MRISSSGSGRGERKERKERTESKVRKPNAAERLPGHLWAKIFETRALMKDCSEVTEKGKRCGTGTNRFQYEMKTKGESARLDCQEYCAKAVPCNAIDPKGFPKGLTIQLSTGRKVKFTLRPGPIFTLSHKDVECSGQQLDVYIQFEYDVDDDRAIVSESAIESSDGEELDFASVDIGSLSFEQMWDIMCYYRKAGANVYLEFHLVPEEDLTRDQVEELLRREKSHEIIGAGAAFLASSEAADIEPDVQVISFEFESTEDAQVRCDPWLQKIVDAVTDA